MSSRNNRSPTIVLVSRPSAEVELPLPLSLFLAGSCFSEKRQLFKLHSCSPPLFFGEFQVFLAWLPSATRLFFHDDDYHRGRGLEEKQWREYDDLKRREVVVAAAAAAATAKPQSPQMAAQTAAPVGEKEGRGDGGGGLSIGQIPFFLSFPDQGR